MIGRYAVGMVKQTLSCVLLLVAAALGAAPATQPLQGNPGNVFLDGEEVMIAAPPEFGDWRALDYDGKEVRAGKLAQGKAQLGKLLPGYYELRSADGKKSISLAVLTPLAARPAKDSPIGIDVAMSWFFQDAQKPAVANFCALAGINWVRDRLNWNDVQSQKGKFLASKYDVSAQVESAAGLRVLTVNHITAGWAGSPWNRMPTDLRSAYDFYRDAAQRWKGRIAAIEPWNEADLENFGGQTGADIASFQKACYLGLKAGNPDVLACLAPFATQRRSTLDDFAANEPAAYFNTFNFHIYGPIESYPSTFAAFADIAHGRPLWVTEFSIPLHFADLTSQEFSGGDLKLQAENLTATYAAALNEDAAAVCYFMLPHYVEGNTQFGLLRKDLTPRPAFVALAAVGRLLADAKPVGRVKAEEGIYAYLFRARPDGQERDVLVAWTKAKAATLELPAAPTSLFDHLGREVHSAGKSLALSRAPLYVILKSGAARELRIMPAPARKQFPPLENPSPVVLQVVWPAEPGSMSSSAHGISSEKPQTVQVFAYNFSDHAVRGKLLVAGNEKWKLSLPQRVELAAGDRKELPLEIDCGGIAPKRTETLAIRGDFAEDGRAVLSFRVQPNPVKLVKKSGPVLAAANDPRRWKGEITANSNLEIAGKQGLVAVDGKLGQGDRWIYPRIDFDKSDRPAADVKELHFTLSDVEGEAHFRVLLIEENGASYIAELVKQPKLGETVEAVVVLEDATFGSGWSPPDDNAQLDVDKVRAIKLGCNTTQDHVRYAFKDLRWVSY